MRIIILISLISAILVTTRMAPAAPANACKQCQDQQRACMANYPTKTCKAEYDICMKSCRAKP